jgi:glyoxylase-like metal-dependent hydrolase (beta-lactamase superfamily II)
VIFGIYIILIELYKSMKTEKSPLPAKPVAEFWYGLKPVANNIVWLREVFVDNYSVGDSWLVRGSEYDLVVDTCSGIVPLEPIIDSICDKPVLAVALNSSYDHCGGWSGFENRACHPLDARALLHPAEQDNAVSDYLDDERLYALPYPGYTTTIYERKGAEPTRLVDDGEIIDLGNRSIEVMHTPGRGAGGISLWEAGTGCLFTSDMLYDGEHGLAWPPGNPVSYIESLRRFLKLPVTVVHGGHYGSFDRPRMCEIINEQIADLEQ